jgi:actin-related protein 3
VGRDMVEEYRAYDVDPAKWFKKWVGRNSRTKAEYTIDVGYERFLAAEMFFNPEIYSSDFTKPLPEVVDESILGCPVDTRKPLYSNIVLSGGSTMFTNFRSRLQREVKGLVSKRIADNWKKHKAAGTPPEMKVEVCKHDMQRYAVWFGGSMLASDGAFARMCHTKAQYQEEGPRIARHNPVFSVTF